MARIPLATAEQFRAAEQAMAEHLGLELTERTLEIRGPGGRARVIESGAGAPLLHVHGGGSNASSWLPLMAELPGRRSIAVDRPGCGLSPQYVYDRGEDLREHAVSFLEAVLDALGLERVDLVANSMGGLWSSWFALARPDRVRSMSLLGCPALVVGTSAPLPLRVLSRRGIGASLERPQSSKGLARVFSMMGEDPDVIDRVLPGLLDLARIGGNLPGRAESFRSLLARVLRLRGARSDCSLGTVELAGLNIDPLVIWGERDPFGDLDAARRFAEATGGRLHVVAAGHLPWLEQTRRCAELIADHVGELD